MALIRVAYDTGAIFIDGRDDPIVPNTLIANLNGSIISIWTRRGTAPLVLTDFTKIADGAGNGFASAADAMAYLAAQFAMVPTTDIPSATAVASFGLPRGMPVAVSRANAQLLPARADTIGACFVAGLMREDVAAGFVGNATRNPVTLSDWTAITGASTLATGQPYFLAPTGGMTIAPPSAPNSICSVRLGQATSPQTFLFRQSDPIRL